MFKASRDFRDGNLLNFAKKLPKERLETIWAKDIEGHLQTGKCEAV